MLIPEDFRHDQYIITPIFQKIFAGLGKPNAKIITCTDPLLGGIGEALKPDRLSEIFDQYNGMVDIYILCVDRDADQGRQARLEELEAQFNVDGRNFMTVAAIEELETWLLAGLDDQLEHPWTVVRSERDPKERYYLPLAKAKGLLVSPGQGRRALGRLAASNTGRIMQRCQEDLGALVAKIEAILN